MSDLYTMNREVSRKIGCKLTKFCAHLVDHLEISHFYHYLLTDKGEFASAGLNQKWHDCLFSGRDCYLALPHFRDMKNNQGRIIFTQAIENEHWQRLAKVATEEFNVNLGLQISIATDEGQEAFGFGLKSVDPFVHLAFLNELPAIYDFIQAYRREFQSAFLKDNLVDVAALVGQSFYNPSNNSFNRHRLRNTYCEAANPFTRRESEVVCYLLDGYSASEIAEKLFISKRTVEHHLERMKEKLDCLSKSELIQNVRKLQTFGYKFN